MGMICDILRLVGSILLTVVAPLCADELKEWTPKIVACLTDRAVRRLPSEYRDRYAEEWASHIEEIPGNLSKIWTAFRYGAAAQTINQMADQMSQGQIDDRIEVLTGKLAKGIQFVVFLMLRWQFRRKFGSERFRNVIALLSHFYEPALRSELRRQMTGSERRSQNDTNWPYVLLRRSLDDAINAVQLYRSENSQKSVDGS